MRIAIFQDPAFAAMPTYTAADVAAALRAADHDAATVDAAGLARLDRRQADVLVLPYVDGTFSESALAGMVGFHAAGGGLVVLGDLPHQGPWYPLRNMQGDRLRLTRGSGPFRIDGLSASGRDILGWDALPDPAFFASRILPALRITAHPPDTTHRLLVSADRDMAWQATPVIAVERAGAPFLGARFAMVAFNGGEPRENTAGVCDLPWRHDPGLLTREWRGMDPLLLRLVDWCRPRDLAVRLDMTPVHRENDENTASACVRNLGDTPMRITLRLDGRDTGPSHDLPPGEHRIPLPLPARSFGIHRHTLVAARDTGGEARHEVAEYVLPDDAPDFPGYGFSTYWAFPGGEPVEAFFTFCRAMQGRGCQYVRVNIPWEDVEPEPGRYDWTLPDAMLAFARNCGLRLRFWMFPTTRGSGLGDAGVPAWTLREPAIAVDGRVGNFPTLWSPFYRRHYFAMVEAFGRRYADAPELDRMVIDFGNSDFPYGYFYYGGDNTLFDYSPHEAAAFRQFLVRKGVETPEDFRVPTPADIPMWREYLAFRQWSVQQGVHEVEAILRKACPKKIPDDLPGHGAGSIADLSSFGLDVKKRHRHEEPTEEDELCRLHNAGASWGGEAWQVGARYPEYDDALFQSLRLDADYLSLPGVDLGVDGDDVARIGFIRRTVMGARREMPEVAIFDRLEWNAWQSLAQVGSRLDVEVDLLQPAHRHDFAGYKAVVLPPDPWGAPGTITGGGSGCLVPQDAAWWSRLRSAVERGCNLLLFPGTVAAEGLPLRESLGLPDVRYGERGERVAHWPQAMGGGASRGRARSVDVPGDVAVTDEHGAPLLVRHPVGRGAFWFAGYDTLADSLDGAIHCERDATYGRHTLTRFLKVVGVRPNNLDTGHANAWKSVVRRGSHRFLLAFSHRPEAVPVVFSLRAETSIASGYDLATGERVDLQAARPGWWRLELTLPPRQGRYILLKH